MTGQSGASKIVLGYSMTCMNLVARAKELIGQTNLFTFVVKSVFLAGVVAAAICFLCFLSSGPAVAQTAVTLSTGVVSWWPGDGTANDIIDGNNGSVVGNVGFAPGLIGKAFAFNGSASWVSAGNAANLQVSSGDFTIEGWVYYNSLFGSDSVTCNPAAGCDMSIADKMFSPTLSGYNSDGWRLLKQANNYFLFCFGGGTGNGCGNTPQNTTSVFTSVGSVAAMMWYHVAAVKSANTITLYVNGVLAAQNTLGPFTDSNIANLFIGAGNGVASGGGAFSNGLIDELTLYNRALNSSEISAIFVAGSSGKYKFTPVTIVVNPGVSPPVLTRSSVKLMQVAILSKPNFDATQINADTIRLAGAAVSLTGRIGQCQQQDVNADGVLDLLCGVKLPEDVSSGTTMLVLEAKTFGGQAVRGEQEIQIGPARLNRE